MKKVIRTMAIFASMCVIATGCQKEQMIEPQGVIAEVSAIYTVHYTIDGIPSSIVLYGEQAWYDFLNYLFALVKEGYDVSFCEENASANVVSSKETVIYTTSSEDEAFAWANEMAKAGYAVSVKYDEETGIFTCIAIK